MILRKPYAFFIRMFKPIHLVLAILVAYLIYLQNIILSFLNSYIYSNANTTSKELVSTPLFIIPLIVIIFSMIILGIMFRKKKPILFYIINIFAFIVVIVINLYVANFLGILEKSVVAIRIVKLMHDLVLINMIVESISFAFLIVRGMGVNFKKFDFDSEIAKFDINESDKEEFELSINVDLNKTKTNRRRRLRYLKYSYAENKVLINSIIVVFLVFVAFILYFVFKPVKYNEEGNIYNTNSFSYVIDETLILNTDYHGNKITDDYLVVVKSRFKSFINGNFLYLKDFSLKIGDSIFRPTTKYSKLLVDLGSVYDERILSTEFDNYLFVFEIPEKYITSDMLFRYNDKGNIDKIKLNPKHLTINDALIEKNIGDEISFTDSLKDISFKINSYDINDKYLINYNYCVKDDDCLKSKEYLKATLNTNFDKYILKLDVEYNGNSDLKLDTFYKLFSKFGSIVYEINGVWYAQITNFEEIKSNKVSAGNDVYIGINSEISNSTSIKLVFNIRGSRYEYVLK